MHADVLVARCLREEKASTFEIDKVYTSAETSLESEGEEALVEITASLTLPGRPGDVWDITLLRTQAWLDEHVVDGRTFEIQLSNTVVGTAEILRVEPWRRTNNDAGRTVTATFAHLSEEVYDLELVGVEGVIRGTWDHPFFSADRREWVALAELQLGEHLETASGTATVERKSRLEGTYRVYNLEVEGDHEYFITSDAVRVHNCPDVDEKLIEVHRGVHAEHPDLANAMEGKAVPRGGHSDVDADSLGDNASEFTSWSTSEGVAERFAGQKGPGGVVLTTKVPESKVLRPSEYIEDMNLEREVLLEGVISGASVRGI